MNESPFPVQRSLLSAPALAERALPNYGLSGSSTCRFWSRGINDLYLIETEGEKFVLRISPTDWRSYEHLVSEVELLRFLHGRHISTPQPVPQKDGAFIQTLHAPEGPRYAVLFTFVPGAPPDEMTEVESHRFGQAIARLHTVTDGYPTDRAGFRFEPADMVDRPLDCLRPLFAQHQDDFDYLVRISSDLKKAADKLPRAAPEYGICHGDVNNSNIHFDGPDEWALLDFEYLGYGWRVFDIGAFFNNQLFALGKTERARSISNAFLEGYQSLRHLGPTELEVLPSFVMLRQLWLLGIGAKNLPNMGLSLFRHWVFDRCMPLVRAWMAEPW
jgi:Ser/Thr protein kinase RdoA (MazF antagonist)